MMPFGVAWGANVKLFLIEKLAAVLDTLDMPWGVRVTGAESPRTDGFAEQ
jgi:hypothetical protein